MYPASLNQTGSNSVGKIVPFVHDFGTDRYDRRVVELQVDGKNLSDILIARGYLKPWPHDRGRALGPKPDWCPN